MTIYSDDRFRVLSGALQSGGLDCGCSLGLSILEQPLTCQSGGLQSGGLGLVLQFRAADFGSDQP